MKVQIEQQVARLKDVEQRQLGLQEAIALNRTNFEQAQGQAYTLSDAVGSVERQLTEVDQQISLLEQERIQSQQVMTEQESVYRRSLLDSQRPRDAVDLLL